MSKHEMLARLVVCMGGYAAEEKIYGKENVTSGPSNDLEQATDLARRMVANYAFSDKVGPISVKEGDSVSAKTTELIDQEVRRLCQEALDEACDVTRLSDWYEVLSGLSRSLGVLCHLETLFFMMVFLR
jgi:ATP-dependent Zn protease